MIKPINIGIDLDGVCANFSLIYSAIANNIIGKKCYIVKDTSQIKSWNWHEWYPITKEEDSLIWKYISNSKDFWTALTVLNRESFIYMIRKLQYLPNVNLYFITSRSNTKGLTVAKQSVLWLCRHGCINPQVIVTDFKGDFAKILQLDYFIDDKTENIIEVKTSFPKCEVYVHSAPYNENVEKKINGIIRVNNLTQFTDDVLKKMSNS